MTRSSHIRILIVTGGLLAALALLQVRAYAGPVEWDDSAAVAFGSGCNSTGPFPDTVFIAAGGDVSVLFSDMGVGLTLPAHGLTQVNGCLIRIPIRVDKTVFVGKLTQFLHWGYSKTFDTEAQVEASRGAFLGAPTTSISRYVGTGVKGVQAFLTETATNFYAHPGNCRDKTGLFQVNLAVSGRRETTADSISVRIFGEDIKYEVILEWVGC